MHARCTAAAAAAAAAVAVLVLHAKVDGPEHPAQIHSMINLVHALNGQGKRGEGEAVQRQAYHSLLVSHCAQHQQAAAGLCWQDELQARLGCPERQCDVLQSLTSSVLELQTKVLGPDHPDTTRMMDALAVNLIIMHKREEAETLQRQLGKSSWDPVHEARGVEWEEVLQLRTKALGPENPDIIYSMKDLIRNLVGQGKHEEAEAMKRQVRDVRTLHPSHVLELQVKVLGQEHPDTVYTLQSMRNLAPGMKQQVRSSSIKRQTPRASIIKHHRKMPCPGHHEEQGWEATDENSVMHGMLLTIRVLRVLELRVCSISKLLLPRLVAIG
eukprot:1146135-Pelagomonas_calceolata.AAC.6